MNPYTGEIIYTDGTPNPQVAEQELVPIRRELTVKERSEMQIRLYSPCGCGSGKKFKFCCHKTKQPNGENKTVLK
jgi:hypothetical protein